MLQEGESSQAEGRVYKPPPAATYAAAGVFYSLYCSDKPRMKYENSVKARAPCERGT